MTVVALTGGIAAGKTLVAKTLEAHGVAIIDADVISREVVQKGTEGLTLLVERFGTHILGPDGELDRAALGREVFSDSSARADLEAIVHPRVLALSRERFARHEEDNPDVPLVYVVPLLAESGRQGEFDRVVVVHAPREQRVGRLVGRRGLSPNEARKRLDAQASDEARLAIADCVLDASVSEELTVVAATQLAERLVQLWPDRLDQLEPEFPRANR